MAEHHQRVGLAHAAQHAGALGAGQAHLPAAVRAGRDDAALELGAARALAHGRRAARAQHRQRLRRGAAQRQQRVAHEGVEGHQRGHRIARQREQPGRVGLLGAAQRPEREGPPGPHRDLPERDLATAGQQVLGEVGVADADAAAGQHHVGTRDGLVQRGRQGFGVVAHQPEVDHLDVQALERAHQAVAVAVVDAAGVQRLAERAQLVAGGEQRHPQPAHHRDLGDAQRGDQAQVGRAQAPPGRYCRAAAAQVLAAQAAVVAGAQRAGRDADAAAFQPAQLLRHHGVEARRHHRAGHDAHAVAGRGRHRRHIAGMHGGGHPQHRLGAVGQRAAGEGIAVHRRVVMGWHVDRRDHVLGQHAAERLAQRQRLAAVDRADRRGDGGTGSGDVERVAAGHQGGGAEFGHGRWGAAEQRAPVRGSIGR